MLADARDEEESAYKAENLGHYKVLYLRVMVILVDAGLWFVYAVIYM